MGGGPPRAACADEGQRLRGTTSTPGRTSARRFEWNPRCLSHLAARLRGRNGEADDVATEALSDATALAALADSVRGYEDVGAFRRCWRRWA